MSHKHECPDCGERKWCEIPGCILDESDYSQCDDCGEKQRKARAARAAKEE